MVLFNSPLLLAIPLLEVLICSLSTGTMLSWLLICSNSCSPAAQELANSRSATAEKIGIVNLSFLITGKDNRSRSSAKHMWLSVIGGINTLCTIASSRVRCYFRLHIVLNTSVYVWVRSLQSSTGISVGRTTSLPIPQRICRVHFHFQHNFSHLLWC